MKKIFSLIGTGLLFLAALSCVKEEEKVTVNATKGVKPVIVSSTFSAEDESDLVVEYTPATYYYGEEQVSPKLVYYDLALVELNGNPVNVRLDAKAVKGVENTVSVPYLTFLKKLAGAGAKDQSDVVGKIVLRSSVSPDLVEAIMESEGIYDFNFFLELPNTSPYEDYTEVSDWSVTGAISEYGIDWNKDLNMWSNGLGGHVAAHVVLKKGDEIKFRKDQAWTENMGGDMSEVDTDFEVKQGGNNIKIDADGVYDLFLDLTNHTARVAPAFDPYPDMVQTSTWSVIGSLLGTNWDKDFPMFTDGRGSMHVALGIELTADNEFKFRKDADWGVNLGGAFSAVGSEFEVTQNGANIKVGAAGVYDLIVTPDAGTAIVNEASGLKISSIIVSEEPEEPKPEVWSVVGHIADAGWDVDHDMENVSGDTWIIRSLAMNEGDEFKVRADHGWDINYGGPEANAESTIEEGNPYGVYAPVLGEAFEVGSTNIRVPAAGHYDITFDYAANTLLVEEHVAAYSLIGNINGDEWKTDVLMTEDNGVWTSPVVAIDGGFKIRFDYSWADENVYGAQEGFTPTIDSPFTAVQPGSNITLSAGNYKVQFTPATKEVLIKKIDFPEQVYMTGTDFGNWNWDSDEVVELTPVLHNPSWGAEAEGQYWAVRYLTAGNGVKFNGARAWDGNQFGSMGTNEGFTNDNDGNVVVSESGLYMIHIDFKRDILHLEPARIYAIGATVDGGWNEGSADGLFQNNGTLTTFTTLKAGELRMYAASAISTSECWTREFMIFDGKIVYRGNGNDQERVSVKAGQVVTLDFNAGTGSITGEGQAPQYKEEIFVPGSYSTWTPEQAPKLLGKGDGAFKGAVNMRTTDGGNPEFKFVHDGSWIGGTADATAAGAYTLGANDNMNIGAGAYYWSVDLTQNIATATEITKVELMGSFDGGWEKGIDLTYDSASATYTGSVTLGDKAEVKVRFNENWGLTLAGTLDALSAIADGNIPVEVGGTYNIALDLNARTLTLSK